MKTRTNKGNQAQNRIWVIAAIVAVVILFAGGFIYQSHQSKKIAAEKADAARKAAMPVPQVHEDKLEACYLTFLKSKPAHDEGSIVVNWEVNKKGELSSTKLVQNDLKDEKFTKCVMENLKKAQFENLSGAASIPHRYNFKRRSPASL